MLGSHTLREADATLAVHLSGAGTGRPTGETPRTLALTVPLRDVLTLSDMPVK